MSVMGLPVAGRAESQRVRARLIRRCVPRQGLHPAVNDSAILPPAEPNRWVVAAAVMLSSFMVFLDTSVVNVSLPYIAGSLSASIDESTWALTSYLAANAVVLPLAGWLANHFGRKRLMTWSVLTFTAASLLCGLAPTLSDPGALPRHPGPHRRRDDAAVAVGDARGLPAARARARHGLLVGRDRARADHGAGDRRLSHAHLQLALGVLRQRAGRRAVADHAAALRLRSALHQAAGGKDRLPRHGAALPRHRGRSSSCSTRGRRRSGSTPA